MAADGAAGWFRQLARAIFGNTRFPEDPQMEVLEPHSKDAEVNVIRKVSSDTHYSDGKDSIDSGVIPSHSTLGTESTSISSPGECTNSTKLTIEMNEITLQGDYTGRAAASRTYTSPFEGYHLDIDMASLYSQSIKSLPKYRRDQHHYSEQQNGYVERNTSSNIPCSPRLVHRAAGNQKQQVVAKMLRSYPQPDGSYICPIRQPVQNVSDRPPPLPTKARDRPYPKVTVHVPYRRSYSCSQRQSPNGTQMRRAVYVEQMQQAAAARATETGDQRTRSVSHQPIVTMTNEVYNNIPSYTPTHSYPANHNIPQANVTSASIANIHNTAQPHQLHPIVSSHREHEPGYQLTNTTILTTAEGGTRTSVHHTSGRGISVQHISGTPLQFARAGYIGEPYTKSASGVVRRSNSNTSENSSSTYTGSMDYSASSAAISHSKSESPESEKRCPDSLTSSVEGLEDEYNKPELYPEQRVDLPLRIKPRSQVRMTCFDMLHNAHHVLEFLTHKVDILEQSLQLFTDKLSEMSDLAVTTPPCTKIDTEFCICHYTFDSAKLGHGIWKYFCDADRCDFCCKLFEHLASRPGRSCQLSVLDLNLNLILSEALIITGEDNGGLVVFIQAVSPVWANCDEDCLLDLSNFLEYISATVRNGLISVIVDSRASPDPITQLIMDSIHNAQRNSKGGIADASFIVDRPSHTPKRLLQPLGTAGKTTVIEIDFCSLSDCVLKLSPEKLPTQLGGSYQFDADSWIRSYACLEKKVQQHQRAFGEIFQSAHNLSLVPRTIRHAGNVIHQHKNAVDIIDRTTKLLDRSKYTEEGSRYPPDVDDVNSCNILRDAEIRQLLDDLNTFMTGTHVFKDVMDSLQSLGQTGREVSRLKVLAEQRLTKLYGCQKLWICIEEITKTLTLLRRAHDLIHKHRVISNNLKSAQVQINNFNKIKPSVLKLLVQGNELLVESQGVLAEVDCTIPWLEQLSSKLQSELSFLNTFLEKTELLVTDTYYCYKTLDQAYDWAVESMKFVSSMNMDDCLTEEGIDRLSTNLTSFIKDHKIIDKKVFDDASLKAKNLGNKKLIEQCRIARSRCEETKQVLKVRQTTIVRAKEEIEAQKAKRISLEQLVAETNITPLTTSASCTVNTIDEDIWLPQTDVVVPPPTSPPSKTLNSGSSVKDDTNNNTTTDRKTNISDRSGRHLQVQSVKSVPSHSRTKSEDNGVIISDQSDYQNSLTESLDTMASSSQEDILSPDGSQSDILSQSSSEQQTHAVTPLVSNQHKEDSMIKRRSFAGFTASTNAFPSFNNLTKSPTKIADGNVKRLSASDDMSEQDEGLVTVDDDSSCNSNSELGKSVVEKLEELGIDQSPSNKSTRKEDHNQRDSVITGSSDSLTSYHEDHEVLTEDSGALTKSSSSSSNSHDSHNGHHTVQWSPIPVNTHLIQRRNSHQWQSMADLRLTEGEIRSRRTLAHIMNELIQTEKDYVMALNLVVEKYIPEMDREDVPQMLRGSRGIIFGNIEKIYDFHNHYFLKELLECDKEPFRISQCFLDHEKEFLMYALYNKNKPKSDSLMADHGTAFFRSLQTTMGDKMDLSSYLLKPVQRMGKYALIIKQILKECPESAAEYQDLSAAQDMIKFCLQHGNDLLAMDALKECDVNLQEQGTLLLQEEFMVQKSRHKAAKRHIFLFDDMIVFAKAKKLGAGTDEYVYKSSLKTADLGLTENVGGSGNKFQIWFRKRSRENWTLQAPSPQIKNKWVSTFEKILWNQAMKNRESRLTELSSMGIGIKPSLDLKQSEDNIQDRTINTELTHKVNQRKSMPECGESDYAKSPFFLKRTTNTRASSVSSKPLSQSVSANSSSSVHSSSASSTNTSHHSHSKLADISSTPSALHITSTSHGKSVCVEKLK